MNKLSQKYVITLKSYLSVRLTIYSRITSKPRTVYQQVAELHQYASGTRTYVVLTCRLEGKLPEDLCSWRHSDRDSEQWHPSPYNTDNHRLMTLTTFTVGCKNATRKVMLIIVEFNVPLQHIICHISSQPITLLMQNPGLCNQLLGRY